MLKLALRYWKHGLAVTIVLTAILAVRGCIQERDARVAAEALSKERLARFELSKEKADSLHNVLARTDSQVAVAQAHISQLRREAQRSDSIAQAAISEASTRLATAGDSLDATLDSLYAVVPTELEPLARTAKRQHRKERAQARTRSLAYQDQVSALRDELAAADSTDALWHSRHAALQDAYDARGEALERARTALESLTPADTGASWGERFLWGLAGAGVGGLAVAVSVR